MNERMGHLAGVGGLFDGDATNYVFIYFMSMFICITYYQFSIHEVPCNHEQGLINVNIPNQYMIITTFV